MKIWWDVPGILCQIVFGALFKDLFSNGISASFLSSAFLTAFILCVYLAMFWMHSEMDKNCVLHAKNFSKKGLTDMISGLQLRYYSENPQLCASGFYLPSSSHQTSPLPCEGCNWAFGISSLPSQPLYFLTCLYTSVSSFFIVASGILFFPFLLHNCQKLIKPKAKFGSSLCVTIVQNRPIVFFGAITYFFLVIFSTLKTKKHFQHIEINILVSWVKIYDWSDTFT